MNKKISIILCSRNDNYCGDSLGRLVLCLNHTSNILEKNNRLDQAEIILSDWSSNISLEKALEERLNNNTNKIIKHLYISKKKTSVFPTPFSEVHALNFAARMAESEFIGRIDQDTLIGDKFVKWIFKTDANDNLFYFSGRRDMNLLQSEEIKEVNSLDYLNSKNILIEKWANFNKKNPSKFYHEAVGIILIPNKIYKKIGGYDEVNMFYNHMEIEFIERLKTIATLKDLGKKLSASVSENLGSLISTPLTQYPSFFNLFTR